VDLNIISSWSDTGPAWLGGLGGILSVLIAVYALASARRANEAHVVWQPSNEPREDGRASAQWRIVNQSDNVDAHIVDVSDITQDGAQDAIRNDLDAIADVIAPRGWIPLHVDRSLASGYPTIVSITWREAPTGKRARKRIYRRSFYLD
jgi:hypothetical protein